LSRSVRGSTTSTLSTCASSAFLNEPDFIIRLSSVNFAAAASNGSPS
jgi:hypothetical protein